MGIYTDLGVRPVINADARLTRLGGSLMPSVVRAAMDEAAGCYVDMYELQTAVGRRLAELTRNEAAFVCTGCLGWALPCRPRLYGRLLPRTDRAAAEP